MSASGLVTLAFLVLPGALVIAAGAIALWARRRRRRWRTAWDPSTHKRDEVDAREWRKLYEGQPEIPREPEPHFAMNADVHRQSLAPRAFEKLPTATIHGRVDTGGFSFAYGSDGWILLQHLRTAGLRNRMVVQATKVSVEGRGVLELEVRAATGANTSTAFVMRVPVHDIPAMLRAVDEAVDGFAQRKRASSTSIAIEGPKA